MCGVVGLIGSRDASREAFLGLTTLQHRGQDAAGILTYDAGGFHKVRNLGLVDSVFTRENMTGLTGSQALGHARYATSGRGSLDDVQPLVLSYPFGISMVHNGNIVNTASLSRELREKSRRHLLTHSDTEVILNLFADALARATVGGAEITFPQLCEAASAVFSRVVGSYSIVGMIAGHGIVAFRDPNGLRPLAWGKRPGGDLPSGESHMIASETVALEFLGYKVERNFQPGELLFIDLDGKVQSRVIAAREPRHCMFEWVYFASPESVIDDVPVYGARIQLGKALGKLVRSELAARGLGADIVVPVPETSRIAAIALSEELGVPYREVLIKNRYIKRTFILDSQEKRQSAVNLKLSPVRSEIEGKRVVLVDDSIVRGTTSKKIIELVRAAGASKVYFVSTCPPIQNPCYYGIDFPDRSELLAHGRDRAAIERELGADAVIYQDLAGLQKAIGKGLCMACLDGKYPTDVSDGAQLEEARKADRKAVR
jgi:amidophosphoribosyltransferase